VRLEGFGKLKTMYRQLFHHGGLWKNKRTLSVLKGCVLYNFLKSFACFVYFMEKDNTICVYPCISLSGPAVTSDILMKLN
jgi:hypothetical protein